MMTEGNMEQRYEAIEIDGQWFVFDRKNPERAPVQCANAILAEINARIWNLISAPTAL